VNVSPISTGTHFYTALRFVLGKPLRMIDVNYRKNDVDAGGAHKYHLLLNTGREQRDLHSIPV
jgi:hypothetical protein